MWTWSFLISGRLVLIHSGRVVLGATWLTFDTWHVLSLYLRIFFQLTICVSMLYNPILVCENETVCTISFLAEGQSKDLRIFRCYLMFPQLVPVYNGSSRTKTNFYMSWNIYNYLFGYSKMLICLTGFCYSVYNILFD